MEVSSQTSEVEFEDKQTNTSRQGRTVKVQVEYEKILNDLQGQSEQIPESIVEQFLSKVSPLFEEALEEEEIKYFEKYQPEWESGSKYHDLVFNLTIEELKGDVKKKQLEIQDLKWSYSGYSLAASLGRKMIDYQDSNNNDSLIAIWNLNQKGFQKDKPTYLLECEDNIITLEFHPQRSSLLVGGSFSGQIYMWEILNEDITLLCKSRLDDYLHCEAVTALFWQEYKVPGTQQTSYNLLSLSTDGKILVWQLREDNVKLSLSYPVKGFSMKRKKDEVLLKVSGTCMAASLEDKNSVLIGGETGSIFKVVMTPVTLEKKNPLFEQNAKLKWHQDTLLFMNNIPSKAIIEIIGHVEKFVNSRQKKEVTMDDIFDSKPSIDKIYMNIVKFAYEQHFGPVRTLSYSPFHRNIFLTCSSDQSVKIYDQFEVIVLRTSLKIIFFRSLPFMMNDSRFHLNDSLYCSYLKQRAFYQQDLLGQNIYQAHFSQSRPSVFFVSGVGGKIHIYDFLKNTKQACEIIEPFLTNVKQAFQIAQNRRQQDFLAVSYDSCVIGVYQLSNQLIKQQPNELQQFFMLVDQIKNNF